MPVSIRGGVNQSFRLHSGNVTNPALAFVSSNDTGIFLQNGNVGVSVNGIERMRVTQDGLVVSGNVVATGYTGNGSSLTGINNTTVSNVQVANSTYAVLDDTAVSTDGGYVVVNGSGFLGGSVVLVNGAPATSTTVFSFTQLGAQIPAQAAGTYSMHVVRPDSISVSVPLGITYSPFPVWGTSSVLPNVTQNVAFVTTLSATSDSNIIYSNTTSLPPQTTLASNGTLSGNITSVTDDTTFTFNVKATDVEFQDASRTFQLLCILGFAITDLAVMPVAYHSFVVAKKRAYGFGYNYYGQLGTTTNNTTENANPTPTNIMSRGSLSGKSVAQIACGYSHTIVLCTDGTVHSFGYNRYGQLGTATNSGAETANPTPVDISSQGSLSGKTPTYIACGNSHSLIICGDGTLHAFGYNYYGNLGTSTNNSTTNPNPTPINISSQGSLSGKIATKVAGGSTHTVVICSDGTVHTFGANDSGQLGIYQGTYNGGGGNTPNPTPVNISSNGSLSGKIAVDAACGYSHTVILCSDGTVHTFGGNYYGQLGTATNNSTYTAVTTPTNISSNGSLSGKTASAISCGYNHTMVVCTDGSLHAFGNNGSGQLGTTTNNSTGNPNPTPVNVSSQGSLSGRTVTKVSCGSYHTLVLCADKTLHSCGYNYYGQLGNGTSTGTPNPTLTNITSTIVE